MVAWRGRISESCRPGTLLATGLNGPRISAGAPGFMSHRSMLLGAPRLKIMMQARSSFPGLTAPAARADSNCGKENPRAPRVPTWRKSLRLTPLQVWAFPCPVKVSIEDGPDRDSGRDRDSPGAALPQKLYASPPYTIIARQARRLGICPHVLVLSAHGGPRPVP